WRLHGTHPQRCEASGSASGAIDQVRVSYQLADRDDVGPRRAADSARPRRRGNRMKRREFITLLGGAAATTWPIAARAQQASRPVIGFRHPATPDSFVDRLRAFRQGLKDSGYVEGESVAIVYRWAENRLERIPELAADLVRRRVAVIACAGGARAMMDLQAA